MQESHGQARKYEGLNSSIQMVRQMGLCDNQVTGSRNPDSQK